MEITFLLNGQPVSLTSEPPTRSLLEWLRESKGLVGTKEGCNEGDCGACTVLLSDPAGSRAVNACLLMLGQVHGKALRSIEGISGPDGTLHPVQEAMIAMHGAQCGFCTPGIVVSLAAAHLNGRQDHDDVLAGNLCRCTGYAPIVRAAQAASTAPVPEWMRGDQALCAQIAQTPLAATATGAFYPTHSDALAQWYLANPEATLVAGATDIGVWHNKDLRDLGVVAFLGSCTDLQGITRTDSEIRIGAGVTIAALREAIQHSHPAFAELLRRFASEQIRAQATIGGNIANGSPIADTPPALIALGARLHLRKGAARRSLALEEFYLGYRKQDLAEGEFIEAISFPAQGAELQCYKLSKRFDQDISTVCGAFHLTRAGETITAARIAFGGMAATPARAPAAEAALIGQAWTEASFSSAASAIARDFSPINDLRGSAHYRIEAAQGLLMRVFHANAGAQVSVLEVAP